MKLLHLKTIFNYQKHFCFDFYSLNGTKKVYKTFLIKLWFDYTFSYKYKIMFIINMITRYLIGYQNNLFDK